MRKNKLPTSTFKGLSIASSRINSALTVIVIIAISLAGIYLYNLYSTSYAEKGTFLSIFLKDYLPDEFTKPDRLNGYSMTGKVTHHINLNNKGNTYSPLPTNTHLIKITDADQRKNERAENFITLVFYADEETEDELSRMTVSEYNRLNSSRLFNARRLDKAKSLRIFKSPELKRIFSTQDQVSVTIYFYSRNRFANSSDISNGPTIILKDYASMIENISNIEEGQRLALDLLSDEYFAKSEFRDKLIQKIVGFADSPRRAEELLRDWTLIYDRRYPKDLFSLFDFRSLKKESQEHAYHLSRPPSDPNLEHRATSQIFLYSQAPSQSVHLSNDKHYTIELKPGYSPEGIVVIERISHDAEIHHDLREFLNRDKATSTEIIFKSKSGNKFEAELKIYSYYLN